MIEVQIVEPVPLSVYAKVGRVNRNHVQEELLQALRELGRRAVVAEVKEFIPLVPFPLDKVNGETSGLHDRGVMLHVLLVRNQGGGHAGGIAVGLVEKHQSVVGGQGADARKPLCHDEVGKVSVGGGHEDAVHEVELLAIVPKFRRLMLRKEDRFSFRQFADGFDIGGQRPFKCGAFWVMVDPGHEKTRQCEYRDRGDACEYRDMPPLPAQAIDLRQHQREQHEEEANVK